MCLEMQFMFHGKPHLRSFVHGNSLLFLGCLKYLNCQIKFQIFNCSYRPLQCKRVIDFDVNAIGSSSNTIKSSISQPCGSENRGELSRKGYNNLICELCRVGDADEAMALLAQMEALGFRPNAVSYTFLITALGNVGRTLEADAIFQDMIRLGFKPGRKVYNVLLRGFLKKGLLRLADKVLVAIYDLGIRRNQETYEILLNSFMYSKVIGL
ncbi:Pentatricopeptide repeat-containing protein [Camellia lanceoleosa]|uniref:Pentatricopeptide repeat-containing protein n=1 Tax=Camellia lanceoleosa TaxID=1840588 RepID=A0ACC0G1K1_9ERIC|nr:Pentatricopeptide repeat-containing protein [Camellia lanceoleosa]